MSSDLLLEARGVSKSYSMSLSPRERFFEAVFGWTPDKPYHVVLDNIDIEVRRGETLGIMGRNGAGKTTLLGILGNVIEPSSGSSITRYGTIAVLLAVGAGFNPQFTGRQNAELFCSLMGLSSVETAARMGAIIAFAELDDYFDMPLRTYSSGMMARLGFACAIHVDADIVIIDETLAVGDANFRVRCYDRIQQMQRNGQTFLLVSHSPNLVANFCTRTIVIEKGRKVFDGPPLDGLNVYKDIRENLAAGKKSLPSGGSSDLVAPKLRLENVRFNEVTGSDGVKRGNLTCDLLSEATVPNPVVSFGIRNQEGIVICSYDSEHDITQLKPMSTGDRTSLVFEFKNILLAGAYFISARVAEQVGDVTLTLGTHHNIARFDIVGKGTNSGLVDLNATLTTATPSHNDSAPEVAIR
ncbi:MULTISPECIES: ABC transporter ATP-binding protein [Rhizobium]|uniref:ABC transporter ATP-binding protein n=1 Tax=Rhizobium TaxID=379 RepID=UPI00036F57E1|nr:ABC transporter ATP-binding protein [Rhizobium leguminosarum]MBA8836020.1 ABC-type polysaccharide/polyol phosphate transport system ATPase subunit [Rhizobium leguminosarum]MDH6275652.1 ABC-type polysaccharide/polyol phosphate transport system ATPase subunit [Rhizobium leguminosarum]MVO95928.1 ATP-binding cassette domain-containing protein [Rhizobium leguminosarum bv. phaseoli]